MVTARKIMKEISQLEKYSESFDPRRVLDYIKNFLSRVGIPPTESEIKSVIDYLISGANPEIKIYLDQVRKVL